MESSPLEFLPASSYPLWFVTVTLSGEPVNTEKLRAGLQRFGTDNAFATSLRYSADRVEVSYWDEGADLEDVTEVALVTWSEARRVLSLPNWRVVALEVLDQTTLRERSSRGCGPQLLVPGEIKEL